jgi:hypothetical protein
MKKNKLVHNCPKICTCTPLEDLTKLHQELKELRRKARNARNSVNVEFQVSESETKILENDVSLRYETILEIIRDQRNCMQKLMIALNELDDKLCTREKKICQADNEVIISH